MQFATAKYLKLQKLVSTEWSNSRKIVSKHLLHDFWRLYDRFVGTTIVFHLFLLSYMEFFWEAIFAGVNINRKSNFFTSLRNVF